MTLFRFSKMFVMSIYSLYSFFQAVKEYNANNNQLDLTPNMPDDRCVAWFMRAEKTFKPNGTLLYHYQDGTATLRVCTDMEAASVDEVLGAEYRYDTMYEASGGACSIFNVSSSFYYDCPGSASAADDDADVCLKAITTDPAPYGISWAYDTTSSVNASGAFVVNLYESQVDENPCTLTLRKMDGVTEPCTKKYVWAYRRSNAAIKKVCLASVAMTGAFLILEALGVFFVMACGDADTNLLWAIAEDGNLGGLYTAIAVCMKKEPPKEYEPGIVGWLFMLSNTVLVDIVMPSIAVHGCSWQDNRQLLALLIFGILHTVYGVCCGAYQRFFGSSSSGGGGGGGSSIMEMVTNPLRK